MPRIAIRRVPILIIDIKRHICLFEDGNSKIWHIFLPKFNEAASVHNGENYQQLILLEKRGTEIIDEGKKKVGMSPYII